MTKSEPGRDRLAGRVWLQNFGNLAAGETVSTLFRLGAVVIVARRLGPSGFGLASMGIVVGAYLAIVAHSGLDIGGTRSIALDPSHALDDLQDVVGLRLMIGVIVYVAGALIVLALPLDWRTRGLLLGFGLSVITLAADVRWAFVGLQKTRAVAVASASGGLWYLFGTVAFVRGPSALWIFVAVHIGADIIMATLQWWAATRLLGSWRPRRAPKARLVALIKPALPIAVTRSSRTVMISLDVLLVRLFKPSSAVGQYAVAGRIVAVGLTYLGLYYHAYLAALARARVTTEGMGPLISVAMRRATIFGLPALLIALALSPIGIRLVFGSAYQPTVGLLQAMLPSLLLLAYTGIYSQVLLALNQQRRLAVIAVIAGIVNLIVNFTLLPSIGTVGASIATVAAEAVTLVLCLTVTRKVLDEHAVTTATDSALD